MCTVCRGSLPLITAEAQTSLDRHLTQPDVRQRSFARLHTGAKDP